MSSVHHRSGATMIELLAVILLSSLIIFSAYDFLQDALLITKNVEEQTKEDDQFMKLLTQLNQELSNSSQLIYFEHTIVVASTTKKIYEWRYKNDDQTYALVYQQNPNGNLYELNKYSLMSPPSSFTDSSIHIADALHSDKYTLIAPLSSLLTSFSMSILKGSQIVPLTPGNLLNDQESITISFSRVRSYVSSGRASATNREQLITNFTFQLISDKEDISFSTFANRVEKLSPYIANTLIPMKTIPLATVSQIPLGNYTPVNNPGLRTIHASETELPYTIWYSIRIQAEQLQDKYTFISAGTEGSDGVEGERPVTRVGSEPVTNITWKDAIVWLNAWSELHGLNPVYRDPSGTILRNAWYVKPSAVVRTRNNGYRLPSNAEWESVARWLGTNPQPYAIKTGENGIDYYWTPANFASGAMGTDQNSIQQVAWVPTGNPKKTHHVQSKLKNGAQLFDMSGNVAEMTDDLITSDPANPVGYVRGGMFSTTDNQTLTVSHQQYFNIDQKNDGIGFRPFVTMTPKQIIALLELPAPERTAIATESIETEQYTASVRWTTNPSKTPPLDIENRFFASTVYVATVQLIPKKGYALEGLSSSYFTASPSSTGAPMSINTSYQTNSDGIRDGATITITYAATAAPPYNELNIPFKPVAGAIAPDIKAPGNNWSIVDPNDSNNVLYRISGLRWHNHDFNKPFAPKKSYVLTAKITDAAGNPLPNTLASDYFIVPTATKDASGKNTTKFYIKPSGISVLDITFPETETTIDIREINLHKPRTGASPRFTVQSNQFTGTVSWNKTGTLTSLPTTARFEAKTRYTATIQLTAKPGFTLVGTPQNWFNVATAKKTASVAETGTVTAEFDQTILPTISIQNIQVAKPFSFFKPAETISNIDGWSSESIVWKDHTEHVLGASERFKVGMTYTAHIKIKNFKSNIEKTALKATSFKVSYATKTTYDPLTETIHAVFPMTLNVPGTTQVVTAPPIHSNNNPSSSKDTPDPYIDTKKLEELQTAMSSFPATKKVPFGLSDAITDVQISAFMIAKTETTYRLWYEIRKWAEDEGYTFQSLGQAGSSGTINATPSDATQFEPVTMVSWRDILVWLNAYSEYNNQKPVYRTGGADIGAVIRDATDPNIWSQLIIVANNTGYRLPTDQEWEIAARWLGTAPGNVSDAIPILSDRSTSYWTPGTYASGAQDSVFNTSQTTAVAWYKKPETTAIAQKKSNFSDLYDMSGNVWERTYEMSLRGGSYGGGLVNSSDDLRIGAITGGDTGGANRTVGFRIARNAK